MIDLNFAERGFVFGGMAGFCKCLISGEPGNYVRSIDYGSGTVPGRGKESCSLFCCRNGNLGYQWAVSFGYWTDYFCSEEEWVREEAANANKCCVVM